MSEDNHLFSQFDQLSNAYDSIKFVRAPAQKAVQVANISPGESVLDVACGTGWLTIPAAQAVGAMGRICAIDIAPQMIAFAQAKAEAANVNHIEFSVMDGQNPEFEAEQFDVILCGMALFAFPDIAQALANWQRCLKKGGRVVFSSWGKGFLEQFSDLLATRFTEVSGKVVVGEDLISKLDHVAKCRAYLEEAQFSDIAVSMVDMSYFHPTIEAYWQEMQVTVQGLKLNQLTPEQRQIVQECHLDDVSQLMTSEGIRVEAPVIISSARKAIG